MDDTFTIRRLPQTRYGWEYQWKKLNNLPVFLHAITTGLAPTIDSVQEWSCYTWSDWSLRKYLKTKRHILRTACLLHCSHSSTLTILVSTCELVNFMWRFMWPVLIIILATPLNVFNHNTLSAHFVLCKQNVGLINSRAGTKGEFTLRTFVDKNLRRFEPLR